VYFSATSFYFSQRHRDVPAQLFGFTSGTTTASPCHHYNPVKGRLQEKKRIGALLSSLSSACVPLRLFMFRKPKIALLNP